MQCNAKVFLKALCWGILTILCFCFQEPKDICVHAGFCSAVKKSSPMLKLLAAKSIPAAKIVPAVESIPAAKIVPAVESIPALKLFAATKVESATDKSAQVL